jgi:regulator of protease activity HflC (stomatin/prohibitin superfamily)
VGNQSEGDQVGDRSVDGIIIIIIIIIWVFSNLVVGVWAGLICLRKGTVGRHL